jgi:hypothetical protein
MKMHWPIFRTLTFLIVGIFNTVLIRSEDLGTWKNYLGYALLIIGIIDAFFLIKKYLKGKKFIREQNTMWKLLRTEIKYFKWLYVLSLLFVFIVNIGITLDGRWIEAQNDFPGLRIIWIGAGIIVLFFTVLFNKKSGRLRTHKTAPIPNNQIAIVRLLSFVGFWTLLLTILLVFYIINLGSIPNLNWILNLLSITGIMFMINSIPILYSDFYSTYFKTSEKMIIMMFWSTIWIVYISLNVIFSRYFDFISQQFFASTRKSLMELYSTTETTLINLTIGITLFLFSIYTFRKRKLYLE